MITQEEYEEAQELVWDYEDQLKEQGKALDTSDETALNIDLVMQSCVCFANWLLNRNLMMVETVHGYVWRSSMIGGIKYTTEELYKEYCGGSA